MAFYEKMTGSVDEGRALDVYLVFSKVCNTVPPSIESKLG